MTTNPSLLDFQIVPNASPMPEAERLKAFENLGFGTLFTDHMAVVHWHVDKGWHSPEVSARKPFQIDPAASVLHYAQEIFEGMKAYKGADGRITLFRPEENARRFNKSAERMAMPEIPEELFLKAVELEYRYAEDTMPRGVLGLNASMFKGYLRYIANRRAVQIGLDPLFPNEENPFPWMSEMIDLKKERNFFETRVIEYQSGGALSWD